MLKNQFLISSIKKSTSSITKTRIKNKGAHFVLEFDQSQWLKPYVEFNTQKRKEAEKMVTKMVKHSTNWQNNGKLEKQS